MEVARKLYNPYNHIFEVIFKDETVVSGKYTIYSVQTESSVTNIIELICNDTSEDLSIYKMIAKEEMRKHISNRIVESIKKNF